MHRNIARSFSLNGWIFAVLSVSACAGSTRTETTQTASTTPSPREECVAIMRRTVSCSEGFVPALMALRVRLDRPTGIAARHASMGHDAMLALAREEFARDWSDSAIASNCETLANRPAAEREAIMEPERVCAREPDCERFIRCDMTNKERRWTSNQSRSGAPSQSP